LRMTAGGDVVQLGGGDYHSIKGGQSSSGFDSNKNMHFTVFASSEGHAILLANEQRLTYIESGQWPTVKNKTVSATSKPPLSKAVTPTFEYDEENIRKEKRTYSSTPQ